MVFCNVATPVVAARIGELLEHYQPQVIITHNANNELQHLITSMLVGPLPWV